MFDANVRRGARGARGGDGRGARRAMVAQAWRDGLLTLPRGEVVRQHLNHLVHHRGQLTVYLRLVNVPLPSVYGPTADERW